MSFNAETTYRIATTVVQYGAGAYTAHLVSKSFPGSNRNQLILAAILNIVVVDKLQNFIRSRSQTWSREAGYINDKNQLTNNRYVKLGSLLSWGASTITPLFFTFRPFKLGLPNYPTAYACLALSRVVILGLGDLCEVIWPQTWTPTKE